MNATKITAGLAVVSAAALLGYTGVKTLHPSIANAATAAATSAGRVDDFRLTDANLDSHQLYRMKDASAVVIVTQGNGCAEMKDIAGPLKDLRNKYGAKGVEFMMLNSSAKDTRDQVAQEAKSYGVDIPVLMDVDQLVGEQLGVTRTAEVIVIDPKTWRITYRGPIGEGTGSSNWADDAVSATMNGSVVKVAQRNAKGCLISFPNREARAKAQIQNISYASTIAPIIKDKCVACHEPGGIAPMPLTNYEKIKGFAPMIREVIRTQRMPPWQADPSIGHFIGDKSLTDDEKKTLVHWIEAGAPRGAGDDPLAKVEFQAPEWPLGKPDQILDIPAFTVPASGVVDYQRPYTVNPATEGHWIRASTIMPGNRQAVHHILTGYVAQVPANGKINEGNWGQSVGHYAVGADSDVMPKDVGAYLPAGGAVGFQNHYTPFGKQVVDNSRIGLYFYKEPPKMPMHTTVIAQQNLEIPANDGHHKEVAYQTFPHEAVLYSAFIHAHYRADAAYVAIRYPDGKEQMLIALPHYDFNWQRDYYFKDPISVPAGSKIITTYYYDNSKRNPGNPDPTKVVRWGEQSFEEMDYTQLEYRWIGETTDHRVEYDKDLQAARAIGILDTNVDGVIEKAELRGQMGAALKANFDQLDKNHDGVLDATELEAAQALQRGGRRAQQSAALF
jgi:mono/diheme cytochrome c family protein/peroxiredoxin